MNLRDKIKVLCDSTTSAEVKAICESFLQKEKSEKAEEASLLESLLVVRSKDTTVDALLTEQEVLQNSITGIESKISKNAAQKMMDSWGGLGNGKVSNVGNHVNKVMIREKEQESVKEKALLESLRTISSTDQSADKLMKGLEMNSYGIAESVQTLKGSTISTHPQFKYILERFENSLSENVSESKLVKDYVSNLSTFTWDKEVKASYEKIKSLLESRSVELEVQNTISDIRSTDATGFFSGAVDKMSKWLASDNKNVHGLIKEMKSYQFNAHVKNLTNRLLLMENAKGTQFNVPVNSSNCTIGKIYSPVILRGGMQIFRAGSNFYAAAKDTLHKLSEAQVNALPKDFLELCESFFNESVKVSDDNIVMYVGKSKVSIGENTIKVNESEVTADNLGNTLMRYSQGTIFGGKNPLINVAVKLAENVANIMEIDFGKAIFSNLYENAGVYMFRRGNNIYLNKVNASMNENRFFSANGIQAVKFVKQFLSYNVSESLSDLLSGDAKKRVDMEKKLEAVMGNITILEGELNKIEAAIVATPEIADVEEIVTAKTLVGTELNTMRSSWQELNTELKKFENADEEEEGDPVEITDEPEDKGDNKSDDTPPADDKDGDNKDATVTAVVVDVANDAPPADASQVADVTANAAAAPAAGTNSAVDVGLAGASGPQSQTQEIKGNDHLDAGADAAVAAPDAGQVVDSGFAGANGTQATADQNLADAAAIPATSTSAEITVPANLQPNQQDAATDASAASATAPTSVEPAPASVEAGDDKNAVAVVAKEEGEDDEKKNEALDTNVGVKLKGSDKMGKITAANTVEHTYTVLWDDGTTDDYNEDQLEEIKPTSSDNMADNAADAKKSADAMTEKEKTPEEVVSAEPEVVPDMFVKASITIDFGPFKEGEQVEISAADYAAAGEDDPVKVKEAKEDIATIPKKYVKVEDQAPKQEMNEVQSKIDAVMKNLAEIETMVKGNDKMSSKSIEEAMAKLKEYAGALAKEK